MVGPLQRILAVTMKVQVAFGATLPEQVLPLTAKPGTPCGAADGVMPVRFPGPLFVTVKVTGVVLASTRTAPSLEFG